jgi:hypothetical protein
MCHGIVSATQHLPMKKSKTLWKNDNKNATKKMKNNFSSRITSVLADYT